jgi:hypothetical protein
MPEPATPKPPIFISHSAKSPPPLKVLRAIYRALSRDFEVLLDRRRLRPGDDWRRQLHAWMGLCHGAVLLLSENALDDSDWVKREATILGYRNEDEPGFMLVPVLLPPVTAQKLDDGDYGPLELGRVQSVTGGTPAELARKVREALEPLRGATGQKTPLQWAEEVVARILYTELEEGEKNPRPRFEAAAAQMQRSVRWSPRLSYSQQLARHLLGASLIHSARALVSLTPYFKNKEKAESLLDTYLRPFWVDPEALTELPRVQRRPPGQRAVCVNGVEYPFTSESYVLRASGVVRRWVFVPITPPDGYEELLVESPAALLKKLEGDILREGAHQAGFLANEQVTIAKVEAALDRKGKPYFILVPTGFDDGLVSSLRDKFKSFTFFFLRDDVTDAQALGAQHVVLLEPTLPTGLESQIRDLLRDARSDIRLS